MNAGAMPKSGRPPRSATVGRKSNPSPPVFSFHAARMGASEFCLVRDNMRARNAFRWGKERGYWENAEQFLDIIETAHSRKASSPSHQSALVEAILKGAAGVGFESFEVLAMSCRRALATDCSIFLRGAYVETERWAPYVSWRNLSSPGTTR